MRVPIKYKLASIVAIILIPLLLTAERQYLTAFEARHAAIEAETRSQANSIARVIDQEILSSFRIAETLTTHPAFINHDTPSCDRLAARLIPRFDNHLNILAADMAGNNYCSAVDPGKAHRLNYRDKEWFTRAAAGERVVGDMHVSKLFKAPSVMISLPIRNARDKQVGVIGFPLDLTKVSAYLTGISHLPKGAVLLVVDNKSVLLIDSLHPEHVGEKISSPLMRAHLNSDASGLFSEVSLDNKQRLFGYATVSQSGWKVLVGYPSSDARHAAVLASRPYLVASLVITLLALSAVLFISRGLVRNIQTLHEGLRRVEKGELSLQLQLPGGDELSDMAEAFNRMTAERQAAEGRVREARRFLSSVLDGIDEGVVVIDRSCRIISANKGYCNQLHLPTDKVVGQFCHDISHGRATPCGEGGDDEDICVLKRCFETGRHARNIHKHCDSQGNELFVEANAYPLFDEWGGLESCILTITDVTVKVRLEENLREATERYRKLYHEAPDMMHSLDADGRLIICNQTEADTLGYRIDELIGRHFTEFVVSEEQWLCGRHLEVLRETGWCEGEMTLVTREGKHVPVMAKGKVIRDAAGEFLMVDAVLRDIGEKKSLEMQLLQAQKMDAVGTFAGGIAHDFNNILTAIIGYSSLLKMELLDEQQLHSIQQVLSAAERATNLTQSLLAFTRKKSARLEPVELNSVIAGMENILSRLIGEQVDLRTNYRPESIVVMGDRGQLDQIILNLASNARDAMPQGGILSIETSVVDIDDTYPQEEMRSSGRFGVVAVSDNGVGMDMATRQRVFEPFFTTKEVGKGTGLGLSIVYGIVRQYGGHITLYSEPGRGTTFKLYFPVTDNVGVREERQDDPPLHRGVGKVLLAEDAPEVRDLTRSVLENAGYEVMVATDGDEALQLLGRYGAELCLAIIDVVMPKKNGQEVLDEIRKQQPNLPVIFMSGYTANVMSDSALADIPFISKPFSPADLLCLVAEVMKGKQKGS